jgi:tRNA1(Val) A37 N6-methylase TrmN6
MPEGAAPEVAPEIAPEISGGTLLGGRVRHAQHRSGHRTGLEPVLLAAAVPARPGERVLEGGTGSGAALLCLAARVPGLGGVGIERDPALAALARDNAVANGFAGLAVLEGDIAAVRPEGRFDHALANPPWHGAGTASPDAGREAAKRAAPDLFAVWAARLAVPLRQGGTLTLVVAAGGVPACLEGLRGAGCGSLALLPLWPKPGRAAKLVLLQGVKGGRGACRVLPGLVLHREDGGFTAAADAVLRDGAALPL